MSRIVENQEASANLPERRARDFRRFSMTSVRSPVSMALELATARKILARDTDTLPELFLRTMGRLQYKMTVEIITLGRTTVLSAIRFAFYPSVICDPATGARNRVIGLKTNGFRKPFAESNRLEAEIKRNLGGLGYEC